MDFDPDLKLTASASADIAAVVAEAIALRASWSVDRDCSFFPFNSTSDDGDVGGCQCYHVSH